MWPSSRQAHPKHFLPLINGRSLFEINYQVLRKKFKPSQIYVQTNEEQAKMAQKLIPEIPLKNYFLEPEMRNQGPATIFMAAKLYKQDPDDPFFLVQVDLLRLPEDKYLKTIEEAEKVIKKHQKFLTGAAWPKYSIMGVDYFIVGEDAEVSSIPFYKMTKFLGRDTKEEVNKYFKNRSLVNHWNHAAWTPRLMLEACKKYNLGWYRPIEKMIKAFGTKDEDRVVKREYAKMPKGGFDDGLTKNFSEEMLLIELPFTCTDFGTWESVDRYYQKTGKKKDTELLEIDSKDCFVRKEKGKFVAVIGVKDLVIVDTADALLVCRKDQSGRVGEVVNYLRDKKKDKLL